MAENDQRIALIGFGSIGISFAALYLRHTAHVISVYDPRPDLTEHIRSVMPGYLETTRTSLDIDELISSGRLRICSDMVSACLNATIVQEQGPENLAFKQATWSKVVELVEPTTHLWSSTSGITASAQTANQSSSSSVKSRLLIVHPFNPPHVMPLVEIVPSPDTLPAHVEFARTFFDRLPSGHVPVVVRKEVPGFVGNRLAFVLFREACHLVNEGVVSVEDLDRVVENSLGPRWAVTGPFKSYNYGGGSNGLDGFLKNLSGTIQAIADDAGRLDFAGTSYEAGGDGVGREGVQDWPADVVAKTKEAYGLPTAEQFVERDRLLNCVLAAKKS